MKYSVILPVLLSLSFIVRAQDGEPENPHPFAIKWSPASILFGKISLGGEYNLNSKSSITFVAGIPFDKTITQEIDGERESFTHNTFSLMGGYRMYLGKGMGRGLYFEPYLKYLRHEASAQLEADISGTTRQFAFTSDYSGVGIGAQLGVQFIIAKRMVIDFYFLGPEANSAKHTTLSREVGGGPIWSDQDAEDAEREIREFFEDVPILRDKVEITVNASERTVGTNYKGFLPGIRFGLSLGVRF